jgi:SWI/SNF-related matrix-associated actin-dependent regulator of chromatin subfamily A3
LFGRFFTRPIKNGDEEAVVKLRTLMKLVSLRREKKKILNLSLPPKEEVIVTIPLSSKEREAYNSIHTAIRDFVTIMNGNEKSNNETVAANSSAVLTCILRLRQCCNDVSLIPTDALVKLLSFYRGKNGNQVTIISRG